MLLGKLKASDADGNEKIAHYHKSLCKLHTALTEAKFEEKDRMTDAAKMAADIQMLKGFVEKKLVGKTKDEVQAGGKRRSRKGSKKGSRKMSRKGSKKGSRKGSKKGSKKH